MAIYSNQLFRATSTTGFATLGANTFTATQTITPAANSNALAVTGYSLTGTDTHSLFDLAGTWNVGTTVETALKLNITDTASGAASLLFDGQVGGASKFNVTKQGWARGSFSTTFSTDMIFGVGTTWGLSARNATEMFFSTGTAAAYLNTSQFEVNSSTAIGWSATTPGGTQDTSLFRDAAGILAQRNGVAAQTLRVYNTFTDASNYERGVFDWGTTANTLTIGPQAAGTGTTRGVSAIGGWTFSNTVAVPTMNLSANLNLGAATVVNYSGRTRFTSPADGNFLLQNAASTSFGLLLLGGTTSSFPALKVSGTTLQARLADDSAFANIQGKLTTDNAAVTGLVAGALAALTNATLTITDSTGTVYRIPAITP